MSSYLFTYVEDLLVTPTFCTLSQCLTTEPLLLYPEASITVSADGLTVLSAALQQYGLSIPIKSKKNSLEGILVINFWIDFLQVRVFILHYFCHLRNRPYTL